MKRILALDCGATRTRCGLYDEANRLKAEAEGGPSNPAVLGFDRALSSLVHLSREVLGHAGTVECMAAGVAGALDQKTRDLLARKLGSRLGAGCVRVSDDRWPLLLANAGSGAGVVVIAGTGSSVLAQSADLRSVVIGGRGVLLGDEGSAYRLALAALRACVRSIDGLGPKTVLVHEMLRATALEDFNALSLWSLSAAKHEIADLARVVTRCAEEDDVARTCTNEQAERLAGQAAAALDRLSLGKDTPVWLSGGLIEKSPDFRQAFEAALGLECSLAPLRGHLAVLKLALSDRPSKFVSQYKGHDPLTDDAPKLDRMSAIEIVRCMNSEDATVHRAVARAEEKIAETIDLVARAFKRGGRLVYGGAGTSGRLGVLDASECPPTFGVPPGQVIGLMAGGDGAIRSSVEGAEDDGELAAADLRGIDPPLSDRDVVAGISASGTTPYVTAMLEEAKALGAQGVLITCNPACAGQRVIALDTGTEVLPGSTRLKAGSATKMVLNMISTGAMALSGRIYRGLMVGTQPVNTKLKERAVGIVASLTGLERETAAGMLEEAGMSIATAVIMQRKDVDAPSADRILEEAGGDFRKALE
jgi:N-acetylmuramic acid 6-phosphate etherase